MATFRGRRLQIDVYGESHAEAVGAVVKGLPDMTYDAEELRRFMARRKASSAAYSTQRVEADEPVLKGAHDGHVGGDLEIVIANTNVRSGDYAALYGKPRPSHADYAWYAKEGTLDFAGGGRFSARLTAPLTALGGLCKQYLAQKGVTVEAYISAIGKVRGLSYKDADFDLDAIHTPENAFPSPKAAREMQAEIVAAKSAGDSVGGRIECVVRHLPAGIGDNLFEGLEGKIATLLYAIPAVKGVEFGAGFNLAAMRGSEANDALYYDADKVCFATNRAGGINGGISNGNYLAMGVAMRPTPSIALPQRTVDLVAHRDTVIRIEGRHDACVVPRAVAVVEAAVSIALVDEMAE